MATSPVAVVQRLAQAANEHDLDAIVDCFAEGYLNQTPAHPARGFEGKEQVRRNWAQILAGVPDVTARVLATAEDAGTVWSEWQMTGTRPDGSAHEMRGVIIFGVDGELISTARFYLEPVERQSGTVDDAVRRAVTPPAAGRPA
ncbi:MAG TPA: nuclear transport factor 2 family protein [Jatrophihabitans sp.]|uniref:nuclear transport factor 2 family protein n=1 Tax=Jatrophihabitans sp. TaxID=1932789 RepID=UPI002EDEEF97